MMTMLRNFTWVLCLALGWGSVVMAASTWQETGDAGELRTTSQNVTTEEVLGDPLDLGLNLMGNLSGLGGDQADMYRIDITNPSLFSARVLASGGTLEGVQLFLFDATGAGVCANSIENSAVQAEFPLNSCQIEMGPHLIAIAAKNRIPVDAAGDPIFPDPTGQIVSPMTPGSVIASWVNVGQVGEYTIELTGVNIPIPQCDQMTIVDGASIDAPRTLIVQAFDDFSGLVSIQVDTLENTQNDEASVTVSPTDIARLTAMAGTNVVTFPSTPAPVMVEVMEHNLHQDTLLGLTVENRHGQTASCLHTIPARPDIDQPKCIAHIAEPGPPAYVEVTLQDEGTGIKVINFARFRNAVADITFEVSGEVLDCLEDSEPGCTEGEKITFAIPTTDRIILRATKVDPNQRTSVVVRIVDNASHFVGLSDNRVQCVCP